MILFCTPTGQEQRWINDFDNIKKVVIGIGTDNLLSGIEYQIKNTPGLQFVLLFGSAGLTNWKLSHRALYMPEKYWYLLDYKWHRVTNLLMARFKPYVKTLSEGVTNSYQSTHQKKMRIQYENFNIIDMESAFVIRTCNQYQIPIIVIRYVSDRCDKKLMPVGINHFHRKWHAKRMQSKMNAILRALNC